MNGVIDEKAAAEVIKLRKEIARKEHEKEQLLSLIKLKKSMIEANCRTKQDVSIYYLTIYYLARKRQIKSRKNSKCYV